MIEITHSIRLSDDEIDVQFVRSSGPGGQNVNKVATAAQLRFDAAGSPSLSAEVKQRLLKLAGNRATNEGVIVIDARRHRTQERNRQDALERLIDLIQRAAFRPKTRRATRPTRASSRRRMDDKKKRGAVKRNRARKDYSDD